LLGIRHAIANILKDDFLVVIDPGDITEGDFIGIIQKCLNYILNITIIGIVVKVLVIDNVGVLHGILHAHRDKFFGVDIQIIIVILRVENNFRFLHFFLFPGKSNFL
jgi:hypothetical protein